MQFQWTKQEIYLRKIWRRKMEVRGLIYTNAVPVTDIEFRTTPEFENIETALKAKDYRPIAIGDRWGGDTNAWFKLKVDVPKEFAGKQVCLRLDIAGEGCLFAGGKPVCGIDKNHDELVLTDKAKGNEKYEFVLDAIAKYWYDHRDTSVKELKRAEVCTRNQEVFEYYYDIDFLHQLAEQLPEDSPRRAKIIYTVNKSVDEFDYTSTDDASLKKSAVRARKVLKPVMDCRADASATNVAVHGHSHIDVAWLWPYRETKRKTSRTFSTVLRLMEKYPEMIFSQSQAQLYAFAKENYPSIYEEIKKRVKEGKWDVTGSTWVEADCNLCGGESLIRQVVVGKNFFMDEFGIETDVLWLPDVFGYAAALPQILKKARVNYFSTIKINWSQLNHFPYTTFNWKGIDGTSILSHFPPTTDYNALPKPKTLKEQVRWFAEKDRSDWSLLSYGWGDGGGGPEREHLEYLRRSKDIEGLPKCEQMKVSEFFKKIDGFDDYPEWVGELYLELHRGTYTTQAKNKWYNRKAEMLYRDAEMFASVASDYGYLYPYEEMHEQWRDILLHQFHDVIPGSSVHSVYEDTDESYPKIMDFGEKTLLSAVDAVAKKVDTSNVKDPVVVWNSLSWDRKSTVAVECDGKKNVSVVAADGSDVPSQIVDGNIVFTADVPSCGYAVYGLQEVKAKKFDVKTSLSVKKNRLENKYYKIELDNKGVIKSLVLKSNGRELVADGTRANLLQLFEDKPNDYPAWDIDMFYDDKFEDIADVQKIEVVDEGPVQAALEVTRKFGKSKLVQKMVIYADSPRIDFETWVDWHEDNKCLKAVFPVDVNASKARYEIQFGNVERPTHTNTSWDQAKYEVCAHKWADISEEGFGMSLLNDSKYGHHTKGNEMRLTLLRSPKDPDPIADMGEHVFTYSIMPHEGDYIAAETVREAYGLNAPLKAVKTKSSKGELPSSHSFISVDAQNVICETVKRAERDEKSTVLRFYECHNKRARVNVELDMQFAKAAECDLMEDAIGNAEMKGNVLTFDIAPFEIKSFKLTR